MSYDKKIRERAIEYWEKGHTRKETEEVFKVSHSTLHKWKSQLKETASLECKKRRETWRKIEPLIMSNKVTVSFITEVEHVLSNLVGHHF